MGDGGASVIQEGDLWQAAVSISQSPLDYSVEQLLWHILQVAWDSSGLDAFGGPQQSCALTLDTHGRQHQTTSAATPKIPTIVWTS